MPQGVTAVATLLLVGFLGALVAAIDRPWWYAALGAAVIMAVQLAREPHPAFHHSGDVIDLVGMSVIACTVFIMAGWLVGWFIRHFALWLFRHRPHG